MQHLSSSISWDDFKAAVEAWSPTDVNIADIRRMLEFLFFQGTRPPQRSDVLGAGFSALTLFEGLYQHVLTNAATARAERLAAANEGASGGAAPSPDHAGGGSAG